MTNKIWKSTLVDQLCFTTFWTNFTSYNTETFWNFIFIDKISHFCYNYFVRIKQFCEYYQNIICTSFYFSSIYGKQLPFVYKRNFIQNYHISVETHNNSFYNQKLSRPCASHNFHIACTTKRTDCCYDFQNGGNVIVI